MPLMKNYGFCSLKTASQVWTLYFLICSVYHVTFLAFRVNKLGPIVYSLRGVMEGSNCTVVEEENHQVVGEKFELTELLELLTEIVFMFHISISNIVLKAASILCYMALLVTSENSKHKLLLPTVIILPIEVFFRLGVTVFLCSTLGFTHVYTKCFSYLAITRSLIIICGWIPILSFYQESKADDNRMEEVLRK